MALLISLLLLLEEINITPRHLTAVKRFVVLSVNNFDQILLPSRSHDNDNSISDYKATFNEPTNVIERSAQFMAMSPDN